MASTTNIELDRFSVFNRNPPLPLGTHHNTNNHRYQPSFCSAHHRFKHSILFFSWTPPHPIARHNNIIITSELPSMRSLAVLPGIMSLAAASSVLPPQGVCGVIPPRLGSPCQTEGRMLCDLDCSKIVSSLFSFAALHSPSPSKLPPSPLCGSCGLPTD